MNRVQPLERALEAYDGWVTGIRRDQGPTRADTPVIEREVRASGREIWKLNPLARWTSDRIKVFAREHDIPMHPLYEKGYPSIGCAPCTSPVAPGGDERAGRWAGLGKTECGIHLRPSR